LAVSVDVLVHDGVFLWCYFHMQVSSNGTLWGNNIK